MKSILRTNPCCLLYLSNRILWIHNYLRTQFFYYNKISTSYLPISSWE